MRIISFIGDKEVIEKILKHKGLWLNELPRSRAARYQKEFLFNPDAENRGILLIKKKPSPKANAPLQTIETYHNYSHQGIGTYGPEADSQLHPFYLYVDGKHK